MHYSKAREGWVDNENNPYARARRQARYAATQKAFRLLDTHPDKDRSNEDTLQSKRVHNETATHALFVRATLDTADPRKDPYLYEVVIEDTRTGEEEVRAHIYPEGEFITYGDGIAERDKSEEDYDLLTVMGGMQERLDHPKSFLAKDL